MKRKFIWLPRALAITYAAFLSLFALDVFSEGYGFGETIVALFIHLLPTLLIIVSLLLAWRFERIGGLLFIGLGFLYSIVFAPADVIALLITVAPLIIIGLLFLWSGSSRRPRANT
jgi:hypothetical protein